MDTSVASVNSALQRARQTVDERLPEQSQQATLRALGDERLQEVVDAYMDAMGRGDVHAVVDLLAEDAAWTMPPLAGWFQGREALTGFLDDGPLSGEWRWRHLPARANGQAAVGSYAWYPAEETFRPFALDVLTLGENGLAEVTSFIVRSTDGRDVGFYQRWPHQPIDEARAEAVLRRLRPSRPPGLTPKKRRTRCWVIPRQPAASPSTTWRRPASSTARRSGWG